MAISVKHKFTSPKADSLDSTKVQPSNWNADHDLTMGANAVLGRGSGSGNGPAEEIPTGAFGRSMMNTADQDAALTLIGAAPASSATSATTVGTAINAATAKTSLVDADQMPLIDSAAANVMKRITWANLKLSLKAAAADVWAAVANKFITTDMIESASAYVTLANTATPTINWDEGINRHLIASQNTQFQTPSNAQPGTYRTVMVQGNDATLRVITFGAVFQGDIPVLDDVTSAKWYDLTIKCISSTHFTVSAKIAKM